jgi:selT/selW/selH-like putative selenoprotein
VQPGRRSGIFDVLVDGKMIFSKFAQGRFPEHREILDALEQHHPAAP